MNDRQLGSRLLGHAFKIIFFKVGANMLLRRIAIRAAAKNVGH